MSSSRGSKAVGMCSIIGQNEKAPFVRKVDKTFLTFEEDEKPLLVRKKGKPRLISKDYLYAFLENYGETPVIHSSG